MSSVRLRALMLTLAMASAALVAPLRARATIIAEPNNFPAKATLLPTGTLLIDDDLSANVARPDPLLGVFDPAFRILGAVNDNTPGVGDGKGSQLLGVPLRANGSAYFRVTGTGDASFNGSHTQNGSYQITFVIYNAQHVQIKTLSYIDDVRPGMVDNAWVNPAPEGVANGFVDVTVNNLPYPPTGDGVDFFWFAGLTPGQGFTAQLDLAGFNPILGVFNSSFQLLSSNAGGLPSVRGVANAQGRALIGVSGLGDNQFTGAHTQVGAYRLEVAPDIVPEPGSVTLLAVGGLLAGWFALRRRRTAVR